MAIKNSSPFFIFSSFFFLLASTVLDAASNGRWRLLTSSIGISAMHMQLLPSNDILIFDRTDFGPSNLSLPPGLCRVDPADLASPVDCTAHSVLFHLPSGALRPLPLLTDAWCSSASLLPNASLLQTGGFNDGDRTVRVFSGSWVEIPDVLSVRRWYATNQILPDGSVVIVGGRKQFNYEFYPKPAPAESPPQDPCPFGFLEETRDGDAENNLYPFVHLLPDGTLFVFANTRSVILNPTRNWVVRELPKIPDSVPRNYPSSGSSVMLPIDLSGPASGPPAAEVLICGGAEYGNFQAASKGSFLPAARTCGRIVATDPDPSWEMEVMPMARVMGDMVLLPTGDVLIVNGAGAGTSGWELGSDPVTAPVLYRNPAVDGERFAVLSESPTPRMYHSSAILDTQGRVIVGGSNPHENYVFTNVTYPTELSLEAFEPPYLSRELAGMRPRIVTAGVGWSPTILGYGVNFRVRFAVAGRAWGPVKVAVVAPAFATHAFGMNQRMVVLRVDVVVPVAAYTYDASAWAPPTPEVAPPGYYMMFVVHHGVPSAGVWVRFGDGA